MMITPRMLAAAEEAVGRDVDRAELASTLEHFEDATISELKVSLKREVEDFERKGGRDVAQADFIDGLRMALAVKRLPKDPKAWSPRKPEMGAGPKEWMPPPDPALRDALEGRIGRALRDMVREQRAVSRYEGPDEGFSQYVAEEDWDWEFLAIVFNSGYIKSLLDLTADLRLRIPEDILKRARRHMAEDYEKGER